MDDGMGRRRYLQLLGVVGATTLAGCFGQSESETTTDRLPTSTETATATVTETSTATDRRTDTATETETPTETTTETETPEELFAEPVLENDQHLSWEEIDTRFEDEVYQKTVVADDSDVAQAVEDVEVVTDSAVETYLTEDGEQVQREVPAHVNMVAGTLENVHAALRDADVYSEEADMTKTMEGLKYVLDQNDIDSSQVLINELSLGTDEVYHHVLVGQGEDTQKILTYGWNIEDKSTGAFNENVKIPQEQGFKFGIVNGSEENLWALPPGFPEGNKTPDSDEYLSSINFNQVDEYIPTLEQVLEGSGEMTIYKSKLGRIFSYAAENDKLIVGEQESQPWDGVELFNNFNEGGIPNWDPYQEKDDIHYSEAAQDFIDSIIPQEQISENPATAGEDNRNIVTTASLFFHEYIAENEETDMQVDYFEDKGNIEEQIKALEQEDSDFMAMETETGGYILYTTEDAHGPLNVENPALGCDFDRRLTGKNTCLGKGDGLYRSRDERMQNRTGPNEINLEDQP